ncbi:GGDEF domain-containing protein [Shewanella sp. VB17]|uniref:sensor domain-containing diguanylate cyclase n=1 Tax=Shewanella sp. VB17 TaxID=2739432 RepID=UPI001563C19B|nr:sensor domain-containing diguanylate cyclase [Shewanella sp. VB17]NRD74359.1 GGDEF domain-containing protein [Shewanella sp. VB17]
MSNIIGNDKKKFILILFILLLSAFIVTSVISYQVAHNSLSKQIEENALPLTSDNIYSEIQQDLLKPIFISSLMAHDTFVRDWVINMEKEPDQMVRYLREIQDRYETITSFFISEKSKVYYHSTGILKQIQRSDPNDAWYFHVTGLPDSESYEINIDLNSADRSQTVVYVNHKVFDFNRQLIGVTGVGLAVEKVVKLIESYQKKHNRHVYFVDREGNIALHGQQYKGGTTLQSSPALAEFATRILTNASASINYIRDNKKVYLNSRLVPEFKWYLMVEQEETQDEKKLLNTLWGNLMISFLVIVLILIIANLTLGRYQRKLEVMATTDKLTGTANRQIFDEHFLQAINETKRSKAAISIILLDIDHFKNVNDTYGHCIGDLVIKSVAYVIQSQIRSHDLVCRWGGEEFLILLPNLGINHAVEIAEQIRQAIAQNQIKEDEHQINVKVSIGVAEYQSGELSTDLISRADVALYQAKNGGRNQVVLSH